MVFAIYQDQGWKGEDCDCVEVEQKGTLNIFLPPLSFLIPFTKNERDQRKAQISSLIDNCPINQKDHDGRESHARKAVTENDEEIKAKIDSFRVNHSYP